jgi:hypothetical protein
MARVFTAEHVAFLKSRGYKVETIEDVQKFLDTLDANQKKTFFVDFAKWAKSQDSAASEGDSTPTTTSGYKVVHPVHHHGKHYDRGSTVQLTDEQAAPLLDSGHVEE